MLSGRLLLWGPLGARVPTSELSLHRGRGQGFSSTLCTEWELNKLLRLEDLPVPLLSPPPPSPVPPVAAGGTGVGSRCPWGHNSSPLGSVFECDHQHAWPASFGGYRPCRGSGEASWLLHRVLSWRQAGPRLLVSFFAASVAGDAVLCL